MSWTAIINKEGPMYDSNSVSHAQFILQYLLALDVLAAENDGSEHRRESPDTVRAGGEPPCSM